MGFKPEHDMYQIAFQEYPELEVIARGTSLGKLLDLGSLNISLQEQNQENALKVFKFLSKRIITWNVEHPDLDEEDFETEEEFQNATQCPRCGSEAGQLLPTTVDGLMCLDLRFVMKIFFGWMQAVARLPIPKGLSTNDGGTDTEMLMKQLGELQSPLESLEPNLS